VLEVGEVVDLLEENFHFFFRVRANFARLQVFQEHLVGLDEEADVLLNGVVVAFFLLVGVVNKGKSPPRGIHPARKKFAHRGLLGEVNFLLLHLVKVGEDGGLVERVCAEDDGVLRFVITLQRGRGLGRDKTFILVYVGALVNPPRCAR